MCCIHITAHSRPMFTAFSPVVLKYRKNGIAVKAMTERQGCTLDGSPESVRKLTNRENM